MNKTPTGFEYNWPSMSFDDSDENWYINFKKMKVFVFATQQIHSLFFDEENNKLFIVNGGTIFRGGNEQLEGYLAEKELLEL